MFVRKDDLGMETMKDVIVDVATVAIGVYVLMVVFGFFVVPILVWPIRFVWDRIRRRWIRHFQVV